MAPRSGAGGEQRISLREASRRAGVSESTLKRWASERIVPVKGGRWTAPAAAQARVVARMRDRGYSLRQIRAAARDGRLAFGYVEDLLPTAERGTSRRQAARALDLDEDLVERIMTLLGVPVANADRLTDEDVEAIGTIKQVLESGFPLVPLLQLIRVYAQSMRRIAEAEVRLFHLYVHEPLIEDGVAPLEMAEQMSGLAERMFPAMAPITLLRPQPLPASLHRAGRRRPHGVRPRRRPQTEGGGRDGLLLRRPDRVHQIHGRGGRRGGARSGRALRGDGRGDAAGRGERS